MRAEIKQKTARFLPCEPLDLQITCHGWQPLTLEEQLLDSIWVGITVPVSGRGGVALQKECKSPQELWVFLRALTSTPLATLKEEFNYTLPQAYKEIKLIPVNLSTLFK